MTLTEKVQQLKTNGVAGIRVALQWEKMIRDHGEDKATAFYTSLGLNHLETKSIEWEGLTLSREPTEAEKRCVKGIAGAQGTSKEKITTLLTELRTELISDGLKGIKKLDAATYHTLILDTPAEFRSRLRDRLIETHQQGRRLVAAEIGATKSQFKQDDDDEFDDLDTLTDVSTGRVANDVQARITGAAARFTLLGLAGAALLDAVQSEIQAGSVSYIDRAATGLANKVINIGRSDEARDSGYGSVEYSALLDQNVCGPCAEDDGQTATDEDDLTPAPNPECEGGDWCRCFHVFIADTPVEEIPIDEGVSNASAVAPLPSDASVKEVAQAVADNAKAAEPGVSADIKSIVGDNDGTLKGFDFRLKDEASIARKLDLESSELGLTLQEAASQRLNDTLRYTSTFSEDAFTQGVQNTLDRLRLDGYEVSSVRSTWDSFSYRGTNTNITTPNGLKFELQFHTPSSWDLKQGESHTIYEKLRTSKSASDREGYKEQLEKLWNAVPAPKDWASVK